MSDFFELVKQLENSSRVGYDKNTMTWRPHTSPESGTDTIAWGHKLSKEEQKGGYVLLNGKQISFDKVNDKVANKLFEQDWKKSTEEAKSFISEKGDWNNLSESKKLITTELFFNMGNRAKVYTGYRDKVVNNDPKFIQEINRGFYKGERKPENFQSLTTRTNKLKAWYNTTEKQQMQAQQKEIIANESMKYNQEKYMKNNQFEQIHNDINKVFK